MRAAAWSLQVSRIGFSDAGAHADELNDACYRTDLLGTWVRGREVITLERAVHMPTQHHA